MTSGLLTWPKACVSVANNSVLNISSLIVSSCLINIPSVWKFYFCLLVISLLGDKQVAGLLCTSIFLSCLCLSYLLRWQTLGGRTVSQHGAVECLVLLDLLKTAVVVVITFRIFFYVLDILCVLPPGICLLPQLFRHRLCLIKLSSSSWAGFFKLSG